MTQQTDERQPALIGRSGDAREAAEQWINEGRVVGQNQDPHNARLAFLAGDEHGYERGLATAAAEERARIVAILFAAETELVRCGARMTVRQFDQLILGIKNPAGVAEEA